MADLKFTPERRMLIDGQLVFADSGKEFDNISPVTEEVLGTVADASAAEMQRAIKAARRAFDTTDWSTNHQFRKQCLLQLHEALVAEKEELREEIIAETGAPRAVTYMAQVDGPLADGVLWPAHQIDEFPWKRRLPDAEMFGSVSHREVWKEAMGVIGAITPWNYPFEVTINKVAQILATGNTMVLKPAPDTPWNATRLGRIVAEKTDIPAGVFNVVTSSDHLVGEELTLSPDVDMISFTGSTATGKRIMEKGAATLKRVFLELGGKSAMIVLDDADFSAVVPMASIVCMHAGQGCAMQTRLLLPRSRYEEGVELIKAGMSFFPYGDPDDMANMMGPLVSEKQRDRVLGYIQKGIDEGAKLVVGGGKPAQMEKGWYVEPTLFIDVDNSMTIAREEIFGPVLCVIPYDDDADAIRIANENEYGLSGSVFGSHERAVAVAAAIRTGSIGVNGGVWYGADMPYGGYKTSGIGRQNGIEGFEQHLETKIIAWPAGA
ncbi:MAG: aldehyde dehydrogenase family protein [Actinomycetota bacterium]|nr:aldehyde dehydrogenase family protein [Actinomycetota bacterium]